MSYNLITTPAASPVFAGDSTNIVLESSIPVYSDGQEKTVQVWVGNRAAILEMYQDYVEYSGVESIQPTQRQAGQVALTITWGFSLSGGDPEDQAAPTWRVRRIRVTQPLAAHPYWQLEYLPGEGSVIEEHIAQADHALSLGIEYDAAQAGGYEAWVKRYYALRSAGTDSFVAYGFSLAKSFRTTSDADLINAVEHNNQVRSINDIDPPAGIKSMLQAIPKITSYDSSDPSTANYNEDGDEWEWLQIPPEVNGTENGPWSVEAEWIGLEKWSAVLYPGGSWDPPAA